MPNKFQYLKAESISISAIPVIQKIAMIQFKSMWRSIVGFIYLSLCEVLQK